MRTERGEPGARTPRSIAALASQLPSTISWMAAGACVDAPQIDWFPSEGSDAEVAKAVCRACDVREQCLTQALARHEYGIWGGTTERERQRLRMGLLRPE